MEICIAVADWARGPMIWVLGVPGGEGTDATRRRRRKHVGRRGLKRHTSRRGRVANKCPRARQSDRIHRVRRVRAVHRVPRVRRLRRLTLSESGVRRVWTAEAARSTDSG
ncbi:hypothetical protein GCM10010448_40630 [Streptomyces glomeratus]|uniref:Uncharacterized protein n=1 Tax=Streptomyces glomeratus TaxID=284452 RepID=A0ABP6LNW8_9ACTN